MRAFLVILFTILGLGLAAADPYRRRICGRMIHREHNGFILSHKRFLRKMYPKAYDCLWRIQAPPGYRIRLFAPTLSIEYEKHCKFDHLDIYDDSNTRNDQKLFARLCGNERNHYFISSGAYMTLKWISDKGVRKMGFLLRYDFVAANSIAAGPQRILRSTCSKREFKCKYDGLCIPRKFLCDKVNDCGDHSDEKRCPGLPPNSKCTNDEYKCRQNDKCISELYKCDKIKDCPLNDDESQCSPSTRPPVAVSTTSATTVKTTKATTTQTTTEATTTQTTTEATTTQTTTEATTTQSPTTTMTTKPVPLTERPPGPTCGKPKIAPDEDESRVVGGKVAVSGSWFWTVSLRLNGGHTCGGSIIAPRWVLTAAHCVEGYTNPSQWTIVAGLHQESDTTGTQTIRVQRIVVHPRWNSQATDFDYTLLYLASSLTYNNRVGPICLPSKVLDGSVGCFVAGWGETKGTGGAGFLKQAFVKTFTPSECNGFYGGITNRMICAGHREGGRDTCQGDSGGPLMCKIDGTWELHGATSFGGVCAAPNSPGVYARVSTALAWIKGLTGL